MDSTAISTSSSGQYKWWGLGNSTFVNALIDASRNQGKYSKGGSGLVDRHKTLLIANTRGVVRVLAEWRNALKAKRLVQGHRRQLAVAGFDTQDSVVKGRGGSL